MKRLNRKSIVLFVVLVLFVGGLVLWIGPWIPRWQINMAYHKLRLPSELTLQSTTGTGDGVDSVWGVMYSYNSSNDAATTLTDFKQVLAAQGCSRHDLAALTTGEPSREFIADCNHIELDVGASPASPVVSVIVEERPQ